MSESTFKYYAFISYSHKDEDAAEDIQKKLSFYRLPGLVRKENPLLPKHLRPIFRDKTNLNAGLLQESLRSELDVSKFLIVICSPNSADSYWVNEEVKHFIKIGRKEYIIPVIVDGEPQSADSSRECLCPALRRTEDGDEFLGIDAVGDKSRRKEQSVARIAAKLLGLDFDTLWNWQQREQKRRTLRRRLLVGAAVVAVLAGGLAYWHLKLRVTNRYFVNYVDKWGMPTGIHELSKKDIASRAYHYRFEYKAGKLRSVICENSLHKQTDTEEWEEYANRPARQELEYDQKDKNLISINNHYADGSQARYEFRNNYNRVNITNNSDESATGINGRSLTSLEESIFSNERTVSPITSYSYERDEDGFIMREYFRRHHNAAEAACTFDGTYGLEYEHNTDGSIRSISYLGKDGEKRRNQYGVTKRCYEYDERGNLIKSSYFGIDGNPVCNEMKWSSKEKTFDAKGNCIKAVYKDVHGKTTVINRGSAIISREYSEKGFVTKDYYYDADEKLIYGFEYELDETGRVIKKACIGDDGKPKMNDEGYAIVEYKYDSKGYKIEESYFDADGKPVCRNDGIARIVWNDMGDRKSWEQLYFDDEGKPVCYPGDGNAGLLYDYDDRGYTVRQVYIDAKKKPFAIASGCAEIRWEYEYTASGNRFEYTSLFGVDGEPVLERTEGWHKRKYIYDAKERLIGTSYSGTGGNPVMAIFDGGKTVFSSIKNEYDSVGNLIKRSFFDADGKPCSICGDTAQITWKDDDRSLCTEVCFIAADGKTGYYNEYDSDGNVSFSYSKIGDESDEYGNLCRRCFYNQDDKLKNQPDGWAYARWKYDECGNCVEFCFFNKEDVIVNSVSDGYARGSRKFDENRNVIEDTYYAADGTVIIPKESSSEQGAQ